MKKTKRRKRTPRKRYDDNHFLSAVLDFCNIKIGDIDALLDFNKKHEICWTIDDRKRGYAPYASIKHNPGYRYVLEPSYLHIEGFEKMFIEPGTPEYGKLWESIEITQDEIKRFFYKCMKGKLDIGYINEIGSRLKTERVNFVEGDKWTPLLNLFEAADSINEYIERNILYIFINKEGEVFSRIGRCPFCKEYFIKNRDDQKFCNEKHRRDFNNVRIRKTPEHKKYMREYLKGYREEYKNL